MRPERQQQPTDTSIRRLVLVSAFRLSMVWDLLTTFLGSLIFLGCACFIALVLSFVGSLTVEAFLNEIDLGA